MILSECMPREFKDFSDIPAYKYRDMEVISEHGSLTDNKRWPGKEKNVYFWVLLSNNIAVGWNENPSRGWSFPLKSMKKKMG